MTSGLNHFDEHGAARMVDVSPKPNTERQAIAGGLLRMRPETLRLIRAGNVAKGDVLQVARLAGIMASKRTSDLIPLCHPLPLDAVSVDFSYEGLDQLRIMATVRTSGKTGVEMEALTAVSVAALTVYDMCKAVDREMRIESIELLAKSGGKSGNYLRCNASSPNSSADATPADS